MFLKKIFKRDDGDKKIAMVLVVVLLTVVAVILNNQDRQPVGGGFEDEDPKVVSRLVLALKALKEARRQTIAFVDRAKEAIGEIAFDKREAIDWEKKVEDDGLHAVWENVVRQWGPVIKADAKEYGLDWKVMVALICKESSGNPNAVNPKSKTGAYGLGQIIFSTAQDLMPGVTKNDLLVPEINIRLMAMRLAQAKSLMNSEEEVVLAYHFGETGARRQMQAAGQPASQSADWLFVKAIIKVAEKKV